MTKLIFFNVYLSISHLGSRYMQMNIFADLLHKCRKYHGLTQQELVSEIINFSNEFNGLNTTTLSRWETGKTSTSLQKKRNILKLFISRGWLYNGMCHDFIKQRFEHLYEPLSAAFEHNYESLVGNLPKPKSGIDEYHIHTLSSMPDHIEHIIDFETASNPDKYYTVTPSQLRQWCEYPESFCIVSERKAQHLGHFVMLKLKNEVAQKLVRNEINEHSVTVNDFCSENENGTYYIHALYGANPTVTAIVNVRAYLHMFEHMKTIDNIAIFSSRKDGVRLAKPYGIEIVAKGENKEHNFTWHGMLSPVEDILFSDTVLKLIF